MDPSLIGYRRLACKILVQAYHDAAEGNGHSAAARCWLASADAIYLVNLLELDLGGLDHALARLPAPLAEQLQLPGLEISVRGTLRAGSGFVKRHSDKV